MKCPVDGAQLVMTDRSGVEIDYCPQCRGVWLDRGELDKIIDRAVPDVPPAAARGAAGGLGSGAGLTDALRDVLGDRGRRDDDEYRRRRSKSTLGRLFDF